MRGYRQADFKNRSQLADNLVAGSVDNFHGEDVAIIGARMARCAAGSASVR